MTEPLSPGQLEELQGYAEQVVDMLEQHPLEVMHFLLQRLREAPDPVSALELMRLVDEEVVRRQSWKHFT